MLLVKKLKFYNRFKKIVSALHGQKYFKKYAKIFRCRNDQQSTLDIPCLVLLPNYWIKILVDKVLVVHNQESQWSDDSFEKVGVATKYIIDIHF